MPDSSANWQSAFARRICFGVRARTLRSARARHDHGNAPCARGRDVEAVARVEEVHATRRVLGRRGRHRVDADRRLLPLELVDGADPGIRELAQDRADLGVVRRDDEDVLVAQRDARHPWRRSTSIRSRRARERARRPAAPPPATRSRHRRARWAAGGRRSRGSARARGGAAARARGGTASLPS